jgi:phosphoglycerol transferase MdoB-like AlkP superfamily enzyme
MRQFVLKYFKYLLFWLLLFAFYRLLFIIVYHRLCIPDVGSAREALSAFYYALKLDLSMMTYLTLGPMIVSFFWIFFPKNWLSKIIDGLTILNIIVYSFIAFGEIGIYNEWRTKLNYKALAYLEHPQEVFNSISTTTFLLLLAGALALMAFWIWLYYRSFRFTKEKFSAPWYFNTAFVVVIPVMMFYFMRGGFMTIPISQSQSWYSKNQTLNDASVNSGWNLFQNIIDMQLLLKGNPFKSYPDAMATQTVKEIHRIEKDTTINVLSKYRPNIVLIILESWSADLVGALGDSLNITPNFDRLSKEGILFTQLYSSGNRSQQGMASVFGGFPAIPITTLTEHPEKYHRLPSLTQDLNKEGYRSSFYFGGQLIYGNIKSYIMYNQFHKIVEGDDFSSSVPRGKLGVHDEFLFNRHIEDMKTEPEPFFSTMFTLSSHSPYDQPIKNKITKNVPEIDFVNSAWYTDYALGKYIEMARKQPWFSNTLFILVADHSHVSHHQNPLQTFAYHRIPMLWYGPAIKPEFRGMRVDKIASQTDLPATLLKQLGMNVNLYPWSKNLFNPYTPQFAYFEMNDGLGWKSPSGYFVYNKLEDQFLEKKIEPAAEQKTVKDGKSYLQEVFREFLGF